MKVAGPLFAFAVLISLGAVFASCSDGGGANGGGENPRDVRSPYAIPEGPGATLSSPSSGAVEGGKGTRCWNGPGPSGCVDHMSPVTNAQPLGVSPGEILTVGFTIRDPDQLKSAWMAAPQTAPTPAADQVSWALPEPPPALSPAEKTLKAPEAPGRYLLLVFGWWSGQGDVSYGFYVEVK